MILEIRNQELDIDEIGIEIEDIWALLAMDKEMMAAPMRIMRLKDELRFVKQIYQSGERHTMLAILVCPDDSHEAEEQESFSKAINILCTHPLYARYRNKWSYHVKGEDKFVFHELPRSILDELANFSVANFTDSRD